MRFYAWVFIYLILWACIGWPLALLVWFVGTMATWVITWRVDFGTWIEISAYLDTMYLPKPAKSFHHQMKVSETGTVVIPRFPYEGPSVAVLMDFGIAYNDLNPLAVVEMK